MIINRNKKCNIKINDKTIGVSHYATKYHNTKVIYNGIKFDSKKEMQRYKDLELLESTDYICSLELQKNSYFKKDIQMLKAKR